MMKTVPYMNPRMKRVRTLTTAMIALTALFCVYWSINAIRWMVPFVSGDDMQSGVWIEGGVIVTFVRRAAYLILWALIVASVWFTFFAAFRMLLTFRSGVFVVPETCRKIPTFGAVLVAVILGNTLFAILVLPILTWANSPDGVTGNAAPAFNFDSGNTAIILCGLGFFLMGWVLHEGAQMAGGNEGFI